MPSYRLAGNEICDFHFIREPFLFCARQCQVDHNYTDYKFIVWILEFSERATEECDALYLSLSPPPLQIYTYTHMYNIHADWMHNNVWCVHTIYVCVCARMCYFQIKDFFGKKNVSSKISQFWIARHHPRKYFYSNLKARGCILNIFVSQVSCVVTTNIRH